jgi:hypothetical protein
MICLSTKGLKFYYFFEMLIGIKRRMIDIGKKVFTVLLPNVGKCTTELFYAHSHLKCKYDPKSLFCKKIYFGIKTKNFMLISN